MHQTQAVAVLSRATLVPLGVALAASFVIISLAISINNRAFRLEVSIENLSRDVETIKAGIGDRWSRQDQRHWAQLLELENGGAIKVPEVPGR